MYTPICRSVSASLSVLDCLSPLPTSLPLPSMPPRLTYPPGDGGCLLWLQKQATVIHPLPQPMVLICNATKRRSKSSLLSFATSYLSGKTEGEETWVRGEGGG